MDDASSQRIFEAGRAAWPRVNVTLERISQWVADRDGADILHPEDLYLACACHDGDVSALAELEAQHLARVGAFVVKIDPSPAFADEVRQRVRERLLVGGQGERARIADYAGKGPLGSWVRVTAIRVALDLRRAQKPEVAEDGATEGMLVTPDPEMQYIRVRYAPLFQEAFREAMGSLDARDRTILKLYLIDGLNIDRIGELYDVHRATVARWIASAREFLFDRTKERLQLELHMSQGEFESLLGVVRSEIDVSIRRLLET